MMEMVDLGLPSGIKWSSKNLGASCDNNKESWYGDYYAWGENTDKQKYSGDNYKHAKYTWDANYECWQCTEIFKYNTDPEYGNVDNKEIIETIDDPVFINDGYSMPTMEDFEELINPENTKSECIKNYNGIIGLNGMLLTSIKNGNCIFLPFAGYHTENKCYEGMRSYLWSSTLYSDPAYAYALYISTGGADIDEGFDRYYGMPIRPVMK